jgi:hypothetical protein
MVRDGRDLETMTETELMEWKPADTNPMHMVAEKRKMITAQLREQGMTFREIGKIIGVSHVRAAKYMEEIDKVKTIVEIDDTYAMRMVHIIRLNQMYSSIEEKIDAGNMDAIKTGLHIMKRAAKLCGLDKPTASEVSVQGASFGNAMRQILNEN